MDMVSGKGFRPRTTQRLQRDRNKSRNKNIRCVTRQRLLKPNVKAPGRPRMAVVSRATPAIEGDADDNERE